MATAVQPARALKVRSEMPSAARWTAVRKAFLLTTGLRIFYSLFAAVCSPFLTLDKALIRSNALTTGLMSREAHPYLYAFAGVWQRFDTLWYINIARHGYNTPATTVFYPLYPALIRAASLITRSDLAAALVVSTIASFFLIWGALRLFELDYSPRDSFRAVLLWIAWPASFAFFAGYADSLLCALIVWAIYFARTQRWLPAGAAGLLAGCTKALGCFVALPLLWLAWRRRSVTGVIAAVLSLAGTGCFQLWLSISHFPPAAQVYRTYFFTTTAFPWESAIDAVRYLLHTGNFLLSMNLSVLVIAGAVALGRSVRPEYRIFLLASICLFLTKHTNPLLQSTVRYSLALFPVYPLVANWFRDGLWFVSMICICQALNLLLLKAFFEWGLVV